MKAVSLGSQTGAGFVAGGEAAGKPSPSRGQGNRSRAVRLKGLSVKAMLRLAFAVLLIGTLAIGVFSLTQISRLNASAQSIYDQGHVASRAAEEARGHVLRASRAQKMLLTATTAKERDELGADIDKGSQRPCHADSARCNSTSIHPTQPSTSRKNSPQPSPHGAATCATS